MIAYKVVRLGHNDRLCSAYAEGEWSIGYVPGVPTKAKVGKLFVFTTLESAQDFRYYVLGCTYSQVWRCEAKGVTNASFMAGAEERQLLDWWTKPYYRRQNRTPMLKDARMAEEVTLLEKVR